MSSSKIPWPPLAHRHSYAAYAVAQAWYSGDPAQLGHLYGSVDTEVPANMNWPRKLVSRARRWFWGQSTNPGEMPAKIHTPAAADIAATSANLLLGKPPEIKMQSLSTQDRVDKILNDAEWAKLVEALETCAAYGGVFVRVGWDLSMSPDPIISAINPSSAIPTFKWGKLQSVIIHHVVGRPEQDKVWRHLEDHSVGFVAHSLWEGTETDLGEPIPLESSPVTSEWAYDLEGNPTDGMVATDLDRLDVLYLPHMKPNRLAHSDPISCELGQAATAGLESLMDALDEIYSSLRRDVEQGKARILFPHHLLQAAGRGKGGVVDLDRSVYTYIDSQPDTSTDKIEQIQFNIRILEHKEAAGAIWDEIVSRAGYSPQTFGRQGEGVATATEANAKERKTDYTRAKGIRYVSSFLSELVTLLLEVSNNLPGIVVPVEEPTIEFPPLIDDAPLARAQRVQILTGAGVMSVETGVRESHPEWEDPKVEDEVTRLSEEKVANTLPPAVPPALGNHPANMPITPQDPGMATS